MKTLALSSLVLLGLVGCSHPDPASSPASGTMPSQNPGDASGNPSNPMNATPGVTDTVPAPGATTNGTNRPPTSPSSVPPTPH